MNSALRNDLAALLAEVNDELDPVKHAALRKRIEDAVAALVTDTTQEPVHIEQQSEDEFQVHNLPRNEGVWIQVENFDVRLKRTDEGLVVDIYDADCTSQLESIATTYAFDSDTVPFREDDED